MVQLQEAVNLFKLILHKLGSHSFALLAARQVLKQVADNAEGLLLLLAAQALLPMPLDLQREDVDASGVSKQLMCQLLCSPGRSMHRAPVWIAGQAQDEAVNHAQRQLDNSAVLFTACVEQLCRGQPGDRVGTKMHDAAMVQSQVGQAAFTQVAAQSISRQPHLVHDHLDPALCVTQSCNVAQSAPWTCP